MRILVVTSQRPWEVVDPLKTTEATVKTVKIDQTKGIVSRAAGAFTSCRKVLQNEPIDVVILDVYDVPGVSAWIASRITTVPLIVRLVGDRLTSLKDDKIDTERERNNYRKFAMYSLMYNINRPIYSNAKGAIVVSEELKQSVSQTEYFEEGEIEVVPVPLRSNLFSGQSENASSTGTKILTVTNLKYKNKYKGIIDTLEGIEPILENDTQIEYVIAGDGVYRKELIEYIKNNFEPGIAEQIHVAGYVDDIVSEYESADLFVYISYLDGYPNAVLEAQAMGLPVIANRAHGMKEQIQHLETGLFVDPSKPDEVTKEIKNILSDETTRTRIGTSAKQTAFERNSMSKIGDQLLESIEVILQNNPRQTIHE